MFSLAKNLANTDPKKGIIFVVVVVLDGIKWESQPRIVSGSNDNDLLLVCYYARAPCFRLFAFWLFIFISPASFFHVFLSALLLLMLIAILRRRYSGSIFRGGRFFFSLVLLLGCCTTLYTHPSIIEDLSACAFVELGRIVCAV